MVHFLLSVALLETQYVPYYTCVFIKLLDWFGQGPGGVTIKKTGQALVFGIYDEPVTPGQCNLVVERLGDYLTEQGL